MSASINEIGVLFSDGSIQTSARTLSNTVTSVNGSVGAVTGLASVGYGFTWALVYSYYGGATTTNLRANWGDGLFVVHNTTSTTVGVYITSMGLTGGPSEGGNAGVLALEVAPLGGGGGKGNPSGYGYVYKLSKS